MAEDRRLPVGIQSFYEIRKGNYLYVDKTDLIWNLANRGKKYNYLSRPRRFGKSLLVDTLQAYLEGNKALFEGLKIMDLEKEWTKYPVIRMDMSLAGSSAEEIKAYFDDAFFGYEKKYGIELCPGTSLTVRFKNIIHAAHEQAGQQVCILIDEYDAPLQHSWKTDRHEECTEVYRSVFSVLKSEDVHERFVFITGITKFTQISLFSVLNNLSNISFELQYANICGITENEIAENFSPELQLMAEVNEWTLEEAHIRLKEFYDGYHFCRKSKVDIYNPFSLINALSDQELRNYWAASGATSMLPKFVDDMELRLGYFDDCYIDATTLETSDVTGGGAELFLYQSGYLTIKGYEDGVYHLGFPNEEVRQALNRIVVPALTMRTNAQVISNQSMLMRNMSIGNVNEAMKYLKALIADVPYSNKKLASMDMEERYRLIISTIFNAIGYRVEVEHMLATGRIDVIVFATRFIYVMELKLTKNGGLASAEKQMLDRKYMEPFKADKRGVKGIAIELDDLGKGLVDWKEITE